MSEAVCRIGSCGRASVCGIGIGKIFSGIACEEVDVESGGEEFGGEGNQDRCRIRIVGMQRRGVCERAEGRSFDTGVDEFPSCESSEVGSSRHDGYAIEDGDEVGGGGADIDQDSGALWDGACDPCGEGVPIGCGGEIPEFGRFIGVGKFSGSEPDAQGDIGKGCLNGVDDMPNACFFGGVAIGKFAGHGEGEQIGVRCEAAELQELLGEGLV